MQFTMDQLRALDAIERVGSFAGAAQALNKVPSAVSYAIRGLEDAIGVEMFDRTHRKSVLTPSGLRVLAAARAVLDRARELDMLAAELRGGWEPELHVVLDGILPMHLLTDGLRRLAGPDVPTRLRMDVEHQEGVLDRFESDHAHIALVLGFGEGEDTSAYDTVPLPPVELLLLAAPSHPLAAGPSTAASRAGHAELVVRDSSPRYARRPKRPFTENATVVHLSDFHSKRLAILAGAGFGWLPRHLVDRDLDEGRLALLDGDGPNRWRYQPALVTRAGQALGRAGRLFVDTLIARVEWGMVP